MKKILALMLAALAVFTLRANDADDVKATLNKINQLGCELKLAEALQYYAPEYVGVSARGQKVTYADAERIAKAIDVMFDEASSVTAVYKAFAEIQGATLDENQADKARELEKNEELKQEAFPTKFWDPTTGFPGRVLDRLIQNGMKMAVVGDFNTYAGGPFLDFMAEANNGFNLFFVADEDTAFRRLRNALEDDRKLNRA